MAYLETVGMPFRSFSTTFWALRSAGTRYFLHFARVVQFFNSFLYSVNFDWSIATCRFLQAGSFRQSAMSWRLRAYVLLHCFAISCLLAITRPLCSLDQIAGG